MEITIEEALARSDLLFVDLRSPREHAESSIPGAVNIPLFDDDEHHRLGIIYHRRGEQAARRTALEIVAPKLPRLVDQITGSSGNKIPLLYCSRGGMRSLSLYQVLSLTGITVLRLKQGYRAYRRYVSKRLKIFNLSNKFVILHGLTGVGKTDLLKRLAARNLPVLDLEGLARHRGSVFGAVGLDKPRSQKDFDALLLQELEHLSRAPWIIIEGEGRRIGNVYLPKILHRAMLEGHQVLLTAPLATRVDRILETYNPELLSEKGQVELKEALESLRKRLGRRKTDNLLASLEQNDYHTVAEVLCRDYYDHYYSDSRPESASFDDIIDAADLDKAAEKLENKFNQLNRTGVKTDDHS